MINLSAEHLEKISFEIREFEQKLSRLFGMEISLSITTMHDLKVTPSGVAEKVYINLVKRVINHMYGLTEQELSGQKGGPAVSDIRFMAWRIILDEYPRIGTPTLGAMFGKRDHSTVLHGLQKFKDLYETEESFRQKYLQLKNAINNEQTRQPKRAEFVGTDHQAQEQTEGSGRPDQLAKQA